MSLLPASELALFVGPPAPKKLLMSEGMKVTGSDERTDINYRRDKHEYQQNEGRKKFVVVFRRKGSDVVDLCNGVFDKRGMRK